MVNGKLKVDGDLKVDKPSLDRVRCYRLKHYYDLVNRKADKKIHIRLVQKGKKNWCMVKKTQ